MCLGTGLKGVLDLARNVDNNIEARGFFGGGLQVKVDVVAVDGNGAIRVAGCFLVFVVLVLVERLELKGGAACDLGANGRVLL